MNRDEAIRRVEAAKRELQAADALNAVWGPL